MSGIERIAAERQRQIEQEGWTPEHDDEHVDGSLAEAAACYLLTEKHPNAVVQLWPWQPKWWKRSPDNRIRELEKAGALIAAEIDRLERQDQP